MIALPKYVEHDEWEKRFAGRVGNDEDRNRIRARPTNEKDLTEFIIEVCRCVARCEASFTLTGKLLGYTEHPLCRYDIQCSRHKNPKWFSPSMFGPFVPHKHVYNERGVRDDYAWDKCAEPLQMSLPKRRRLTVTQWVDRIGPIFLKEANIEIRDPGAMPLFGH